METHAHKQVGSTSETHAHLDYISKKTFITNTFHEYILLRINAW